MFVVWPTAAADLIKLLDADSIPGIPRSPETIAEILASRGVIERGWNHTLIWEITLKGNDSNIDAVKLASPAMLLECSGFAVAPLAVQLHRAQSARASHTGTIQNSSSAGTGEAAPASDAPEQREPALETIPTPSPPASPAAVEEHQPLLLRLPIGLNPVCDALHDIISSLNEGQAATAVELIDQGLFVPLPEFERRGIDTALAVRSLHDARLLALDSKRPANKTVTRSFGDKQVFGVLLANSVLSRPKPLSPATGMTGR
jgi:conjugal transfer pilus assembly protein TraI